jgi:hypothetical protein
VNEVVFGEEGYFEVLSDDWDQSDEKKFGKTMKEVVEKSIGSSLRKVGESYKVLLLTGPEEEATISIDEILNDSVDKNGAPTAFVQRQRYTSLEKLKKAAKTSDLCK